MKLNVKQKVYTHEGAVACHVSPLQQLQRTVLSCLLWEDNFYEDGIAVAQRIKDLVSQCRPADVAELAMAARDQQHLRHVPLLLVRELVRQSRGKVVEDALYHIIQRADELAEFLSIYWQDGKQPLAKAVKRGLARAFTKFNDYQLAKYNRDGAIKLRDVLFMVHAKPKSEQQAAWWKQLVDGTLPSPDTWEVALSGGDDKKATFERLLTERKLGYLALLRNLRNMYEAGVNRLLVQNALLSGAATSKALPFRFVAAARAVPAWVNMIDKAMMLAMETMPKLSGDTIVLVDVSGSMDCVLSAKSDLTRMDAASALAVLVKGVSDYASVFTFSNRLVEVPSYQGMALISKIIDSQSHQSTYLGGAVNSLQMEVNRPDRIIIITDEQAHDFLGPPCGLGHGYIINVAPYQNGVGYGDWLHINGFSEAVIAYIQAFEDQQIRMLNSDSGERLPFSAF